MSAVFAQEMHQPKCGPNAELICPLRSRSIPAGPRCAGRWGQWALLRCLILALVKHCTAGSRPPPGEGGFEEVERKEITEFNTSLEQAFSSRCHNVSPFPYISISTIARRPSTQSMGGNGTWWPTHPGLEIRDSLASAKETSSWALVCSDWSKRSLWWSHSDFGSRPPELTTLSLPLIFTSYSPPLVFHACSARARSDTSSLKRQIDNIRTAPLRWISAAREIVRADAVP